MYRTWDPDSWNTDTWFRNLPAGAKLLFFYLVTNPNAKPSGAYEIDLDTIVFQTKLEEPKLRQGFATLAPRVTWFEHINFVFVHNFYKRQRAQGSDTFRVAAARQAVELPDEVRTIVLARYPELAEAPPPPPKKRRADRVSDGVDRVPNGKYTLSERENTLPIASTEGTQRVGDRVGDTLRLTVTETGTDSETGTETDKPRARARVSVPYAASFLRVYDAYPKHRNKKEAWEVWKRLAPNAALVATMLAAIARMVAEDRQWRAGYVPGFDRWLRGQHWEDEPEPERQDRNGKIVHLRPVEPPDPETEEMERRYRAYRAELVTYGITEPNRQLRERFGVELDAVYRFDGDYDNVLAFVRERLGIPESEAAHGGG